MLFYPAEPPETIRVQRCWPRAFTCDPLYDKVLHIAWAPPPRDGKPVKAKRPRLARPLSGYTYKFPGTVASCKLNTSAW
jgi:hypothetical protein